MHAQFQILPLDPDYLARIRERRHDHLDNPFIPMTCADEGLPLRCCLRDAQIGESLALIAHQPATVGGPYAEIGPVFVHADACTGYVSHGQYPEAFRDRTQIFRAYDSEGRQVENRMVAGVDADSHISELLAQPGVDFIHSRNVLAGCYMFAILPIGDAAVQPVSRVFRQ